MSQCLPHPHSHCWGAGTPLQFCGVKMLMNEEEGPLGALRVSAQFCICLTSPCPSLNFHSSSLQWNSNAALLRWGEGQMRQPEDVPTQGLARQPALCTHHRYFPCVFPPCIPALLRDRGPWEPAGVGTVGLLVLEEDALVRDGCAGQQGGDGPGSSPPKSFHSICSPWNLWQ